MRHGNDLPVAQLDTDVTQEGLNVFFQMPYGYIISLSRSDRFAFFHQTFADDGIVKAVSESLAGRMRRLIEAGRVDD